MSILELSALPFPDVLATLDFEVELAACKADLISRDPELASVLSFESEPLVKLLQTFAYRQLLKTGEINSKAKALMLAYATGADLDHLAANRGIYRLQIQPANPLATPPTDAVYESDDALRYRVQLAPEKAAAGSEGCYLYWALGADGDVRNIGLDTPTPGFVDVWVQSHGHDVAPVALLDAVATALQPQERRPFTDHVTVKAAMPVDWQLDATLLLFPGFDTAVVLANASAAANRYIALVNNLGYDVVPSGLYAALHQQGVQRVLLNSPATQLVMPKSKYARCTSVSINALEYRDV